MAEIADTVIVGNIIYEDLKAALTTVDAVKSVSRIDTKRCIIKNKCSGRTVTMMNNNC